MVIGHFISRIVKTRWSVSTQTAFLSLIVQDFTENPFLYSFLLYDDRYIGQ